MTLPLSCHGASCETPSRPRQSGFTLTELAVSLVIIALLVGGLTVPLTAQMELRDLNETRKQLDDAREALLGYAVTNGVLPCPASIASNGVAVAGAVAGTCGSTDGLLPWADLGLARTDSWSHQLRYRVLPAFADSTTPFTLGTAVSPNLQIWPDSGSANPLTSANKVVAVILSHGRNGYFGTTDAGVTIANTSAANADEASNNASLTSAAAARFYQRVPSSDTSGANTEFDDLLTWIPVSTLMSRMVVARKISAP